MNWLLLKNSLLVSGLTTLFAVSMGFVTALWVASAGPRMRKILVLLAIVALVLPPFLVANCWLHFLGYTGVWRSWLPLNIFSLGGTVWILALMTWPVTLLFVLAAWRRLEQAQFEADPCLGGSSLIRFLLLPSARTALAQAAVLTFVLALNNFAVPAILQVKVFPAELWVNFNTTFDYRSALQLSWPLVLAPLILIACIRGRELFRPRQQHAVQAEVFRRQLGSRWSRFAALIGLAALVFSVALPAWQLLADAKTWLEFLAAAKAGQSAIGHSLLFAAGTATAIVAVALFSWRLPIGWVSWLFFLVPGVLLGIALIWVFNRPATGLLYQSAGIVVLAYAIRFLPIGWNGIAHALRTTDPELSDAARLHGAGKWQLLRHVQLPQIRPQMFAVWYVVYLLCLWDVETLILIVPPGSETLSLRIFNLLHYGHNAHVNALCVLLLVLAIVPLMVWLAASTARLRFSNPNRVFALVTAFALMSVPGCSRKPEQGHKIESRFFSRVEVIGSRGTGVGQFNKPRSVAIDAEDNLYVVDMTARVQKFAPDGTFVASWQMEETDKGRPKGMSRDREGNIVIIEPHYSRVNHFAPDGEVKARWGAHGTAAGELAFPRAAAVTSRGDIYVSEYGVTERIQKFTASGSEWLLSIGRGGRGAGEFNRAEGIGIDSEDRLYVADSCNHRIQVFSSDGTFLRSYGSAGSRAGEFSYPYDIRVDAAGFQFVCEFGNSRIQIFNAHCQPVEILGEPGSLPGQFANPWSIAFDSKGNLYVADSRNHRVQKFLRK